MNNIVAHLAIIIHLPATKYTLGQTFCPISLNFQEHETMDRKQHKEAATPILTHLFIQYHTFSYGLTIA
jgi:hypothetical protein